MHAVSLFKSGKYDEAIDIFIELDTNPSKVVSLYPESIAGRLSTPEKDWIVLFGGPREEIHITDEPEPLEVATTIEEPPKAGGGGQPTMASTAVALGAAASFRGYLPNLIRPTVKDDDTASIASRRSLRRRMTTEIFETLGVSSTTNSSGAPPVTVTTTPAPTTNASAQLSPGRCGKGSTSIPYSDTPHSRV